MARVAAVLFVVVVCAWAAAAEAVSYWVDVARGSDTRPCTDIDGDTNPGVYRKTIRQGIACLQPGDRLIVRSGVYPERISDPPSGTPATWTTIRSEVPRGATLRPPAYSGSGEYRAITVTNGRSYILFDGFKVDLTLQSSSGGNAGEGRIEITNGQNVHHVEFRNLEVWGNVSNVLVAGKGNHHISLTGSHFHDPRSPTHHAIYWRAEDGLIQGNTIEEAGGLCMQVYSGDGTPVNRNLVEGNVFRKCGTSGLWVGSGDGNRAYSNIVDRNGSYGIQARGTTTKLYNNTVVRNGLHAFNISSPGVEILNAILVLNSGGRMRYASESGLIRHHNWCPTVDLNEGCAFGGDPLFVNAAGGDFHLQPGSPAKNVGAPLSAVVRDIDGQTRPSSTGYEVGADERD